MQATFTYLDLERLNNLDNDIRINMDRMREERIQKLLDVLHDQPEGDGQNCVDAQMGPWGSDQMLGGGAVGGNGFGVDGMGSLGGGAVGEGPGGQAITEEYLRKVHDRQLSQARQQGATEDQILMLRRRQQAQIFQFKRKQQQQSGGIGDGSRPNMSPEQLQQVHKSQIDNLQQDGATSQQLQALQPRQQQQQQQLTQSMLNAGVVSAQRPQITVQHLQQLQDQQLAAARDRGASAHEIQMMQQRHRQQMATLQQQQAGQGGAQASPSLPPTGPVGSSVPQATSQQMQQVHERQIMMLQQQGASDSYIQQIQQKQQAQMNNLLRQQSANSPSPNASGLQGSNFAGMSSSLQTPQLSGQPSPSLGGAAGGGGMPQVTAQQLQQMHERQLNQARQQGASDIQIQQLQLRQQQQLNALHQQQQGSGVNRITNSNSPNFGSPTVTPMQLRQMQERQLQQAQSQGATDEQLQQLRHRHHQQLNALQQQQQLEGSDNLLNRSSSTGGAHRPTPQQLQQLHERQLGQAMQQGASEEQICQLKQQQQQQMTLLRQQLGSLVGSPSLGGRVGSGMGGATPTPQQLQQIHEKQVSQARLHGASDQQIQAMQQRHQVQMATLQQQAGNSGLMQMESISILPVGSGGNQISSMQQMHERQLTQARMQGATEQQIQQLQHRQKQQMMAAQQKQQQQASLGGIVGDNQGSIMGCDSGFRPMGDMGQMSIQRLQQMHEHQLAQAKEQGASEQQLINLQQRQQQQLAALRQQQQQGGNHQLMAQAVTNAPFLGNSDAGLPPANSFRLQQMHEQQLAQAKENGASEQQLLQLKERHRQQLAALQQRIGVTGSQAAAGSMMGGNGSGGQITPQQLQQLQERQMSQARMQGATDQQLQLLQQRHQQQMAALHRQLNGGSGISAWPGDGTGMPQQTMTPHRLQQMQENQLAQARQQGATEQQIQQLKQRHQQQMAALQQQMGGSNPNHAIMMGSIGANQPGPQMTPQQLRQLQERQLNNARQQGATDQQIHQMHLRHQQQMQALQKQQLGGSLVNTGAETPSPCQMTTQQLKAIQEKQLSQALSKGATAEQIDALQLRHQQQMMMLQQQQQGLGSDVQMSPQQLQQMHEKQLNQAKLQGATDQQIQSMQQRHQAQLAALQQQCSSSANFGPEMTERQLKEFHDKQLAHAKQQKASQQQLQALQQRQQAQMVSLQRRLSVQQQPKSPALSQPQSQPMQQVSQSLTTKLSPGRDTCQ